jgi:hypothetical protein
MKLAEASLHRSTMMDRLDSQTRDHQTQPTENGVCNAGKQRRIRLFRRLSALWSGSEGRQNVLFPYSSTKEFEFEIILAFQTSYSRDATKYWKKSLLS